MSTPISDFDSFLDDIALDSGSSNRPSGVGSGNPIYESVNSNGIGWVEPGYEGSIDYRIRQLSYSSILTLHTCPRKFELYKKRTEYRTEESEISTITFSFGHVLGEAIQLALNPSVTYEQIVLKMFTTWHADLFSYDEKGAKNFWEAMIALKRFMSLREAGFLNEYELVFHEGKPACELSFAITFPDAFRYRGYVDAVLRHKTTGEVLVLECKTTGSKTLSPTTYKNSAQAIGYSIVLDAIFDHLSSYKVLYLIYQTHSREYTQIPFTKTYLQRALWIRELLLDIETIKMYEEAGVYPMHGESCFNFFRDCEYLASCTMSNTHITKMATPEVEDKTEYQINLSLADLLENQLALATHSDKSNVNFEGETL
jgi:hypothetical protein